MKRFLFAAGLCLTLLAAGFFILSPNPMRAENNVLQNLLDVPAPPPPNPLVKHISRAENFYDKDNPPKDDAPIEDLTDYWDRQSSGYRELGYNVKPSEKTVRRILAEIEKDPERLTDFLNVLPENRETGELVKSLYDREISDKKFDAAWRNAVRKWLTYHSPYFSDELLKKASETRDEGEYVTNQAELLALARVDWDKAEPLLERLSGDDRQPVSKALALWAFYRHALDGDDTSDIEKYRAALKKIVEDKNATDGARDLAFDALVKERDFEGRDEWFYSLLGDETLYDLRVNGQSYTGLTTILIYSPPEKYAAKMIELVKSDNRAVRDAAARNLGRIIRDSASPEVVRALLPWLENPEWAKDADAVRGQLVRALQGIEMPESVPGLIAVLNEKYTRPIADANNNVRQVEIYPYRDAAVDALGTQKDARAVPALRLLLSQVEGHPRGSVVKALLACGGFSVVEQVEGLESFAREVDRQQQKRLEAEELRRSQAANVALPQGDGSIEYKRQAVVVARLGSGEKNTGVEISDGQAATARFDTEMLLGALLFMPNREPGGELIAALVERIDYLEKKEPPVARLLRNVIQKWRGAAVNSLLLRDLKNNRLDADGIIKLLSLRGELREKQFNEVSDIRGGSSIALGISACLTEENSDYDAILAAGENPEAKIAMLGCARLIRAKLPVREVGKYLSSPNPLLAVAAERYLESEDSPEARRLVLAKYPNQARVLGARLSFSSKDDSISGYQFLPALFASVDESFPIAWFYSYDKDFSHLKAVEKRLQKEAGENPELLGIYSYDVNSIRIFKDKAVFRWEEDKARYRERVLNKEEFDRLKAYLAAQRVDEMTPFLTACDDDCEVKELLMLGRGGGRRVFHRGDKAPEFFDGLGRMFEEMRQPPAKLHYWLEKNIGGLEILFEDPHLQADAVWKNGADFRLLISDEPRRKQIDKELERQAGNLDSDTEDYPQELEKFREQTRRRKYENFAWYKFDASAGRLSGLTGQPAEINFIPAPDDMPAPSSQRQWKARAPALEIRAGRAGLYKIVRGQAVKIREGIYRKPVVTPDGRWVVASRLEDGEPLLVRVNLSTGREFVVKANDSFPVPEAVVFIPSINKVLVGEYSGGDEAEFEEYGEYPDGEDEESAEINSGRFFLLDAETGLGQEVKGELRPLAQQTFRPLQPTARPGEFWAAIPDKEKNTTEFGIYNSKTFSFKSLAKLPQIIFDSMNMWVDERDAKIYFVYQGHLLAAPLPRVAPVSPAARR